MSIDVLDLKIKLFFLLPRENIKKTTITMKPSPKYDFPVAVWHQIWEVDPKNAPLYQGVFSVILNFQTTVMFVPEFERDDNDWPPVIPMDIDDVHTIQEARLITTAMSKYTVTPNLLLVGQTEIMPPFEPDILEAGVIFYVSPQEFNIFNRELSTIQDMIPGSTSSLRISDIQDTEFAKFILERIITSKHFSEKDLKMLGRTREDGQLNLAKLD